MALTVTAPLVLLRTRENTVVYVYGPAPLPENASPEHVKHLVEAGLVEDLSAGEPIPAEPATPVNPVADPGLSEDALRDMDYADLQKLAAEQGVRANQSKDDLIAALSALSVI